MSDAIFMLRLEHANIASVLDLLDDQFLRLESGAPVDRPLQLLAVEYLMDYPEDCHHPKEDLVFRKLERRDPARAADLSDLVGDHDRLAQMTECFAKDVRRTLDAPKGAPIESLRLYIGAYRQHIAEEERSFLPAALECLTRDDLAELDFQLFDRRDHLFDHATEARFERLRREIKRRTAAASSGVGDGRDSTDELALLRDLRSVTRFNEAMLESGLRLVPYRAGGYALERDGHWLLDIPDCEEIRAAWCAYFYAKGIRTDKSGTEASENDGTEARRVDAPTNG
jgi:hemerythrin-like domain-containing protein